MQFWFRIAHIFLIFCLFVYYVRFGLTHTICGWWIFIKHTCLSYIFVANKLCLYIIKRKTFFPFLHAISDNPFAPYYMNYKLNFPASSSTQIRPKKESVDGKPLVCKCGRQFAHKQHLKYHQKWECNEKIVISKRTTPG